MPNVGVSVDPNDVRAAIRVTLTAEHLPDAIITSPVFLGAAEEEVLRRDPLAATRTGENALRITRALTFFLAATLLPSIPMVTLDRLGPSTTTVSPINILQLGLDLRARANGEMDAVLADVAVDPLSPDNLPTLFTVAGAGPRRLGRLYRW